MEFVGNLAKYQGGNSADTYVLFAEPGGANSIRIFSLEEFKNASI
jgi:hypothetical protein